MTQDVANDVAYASLNGLSSYGSFTLIPNGSSIYVTNVFTSGNNGQVLYFGFAFTNMSPFTLASIMSTQTVGSTLYYGTLGDDGITFTDFGEGISTNGTVYTTDNADTPITTVVGSGYGFSMPIGTETIAQALLGFPPSTVLQVGASYTVDGQTVSVTEYLTGVNVVPEPNSGWIIILGGIIVMLANRSLNWLRRPFKTKPK
jgi:hypothetical protein